MSDKDLATQLLAALGELKAEMAATTTEVKNIVQRLDKLNGTVARHEERFGTQNIDLIQHASQCPRYGTGSHRSKPSSLRRTPSRRSRRPGWTGLFG